MLTEEEIKKGLPKIIQNACQMMLKDTLFQKVIMDLQQIPGYRLEVYLEEWNQRHYQETRYLMGTFHQDNFYPWHFDKEQEWEFRKRLSKQLPSNAIGRERYRELSRNIVQHLSESFCEGTIPSFWEHWDNKRKKLESEVYEPTPEDNGQEPESRNLNLDELLVDFDPVKLLENVIYPDTFKRESEELDFPRKSGHVEKVIS